MIPVQCACVRCQEDEDRPEAICKLRGRFLCSQRHSIVTGKYGNTPPLSCDAGSDPGRTTAHLTGEPSQRTLPGSRELQTLLP